MPPDNSFDKKYNELTFLIDQEFNRNISLHGDKIKCSKGCSKCCSQIFRITSADAGVIKEYLSFLTIEDQKILKHKAEIYLEEREAVINDQENDFTKLPKQPCPALDESGTCMIYPARPVICRRFGPPVYDYKDPGKLYACELNFAAGEEINDNALIKEQTNIGIKWDELKTEFNIKNDLNKNASTTIAEALLLT